jgi:hypothetical protein
MLSSPSSASSAQASFTPTSPGSIAATLVITEDGFQASSSLTITVLPATPQLDLAYGIKQLKFSWDAFASSTHYQLLENPDGSSGFTQVGADITGLSVDVDIPVQLHNWVNARYMLAACDGSACVNSTEVSTIDQSVNSIGYFKASNSEDQDSFGGSVTLSADGNTLMVGASWEESAATGIDGDQADAAEGAGAAYLY